MHCTGTPPAMMQPVLTAIHSVQHQAPCSKLLHLKLGRMSHLSHVCILMTCLSEPDAKSSRRSSFENQRLADSVLTTNLASGCFVVTRCSPPAPLACFFAPLPQIPHAPHAARNNTPSSQHWSFGGSVQLDWTTILTTVLYMSSPAATRFFSSQGQGVLYIVA